jgi:micrococcal nuclease
MKYFLFIVCCLFVQEKEYLTVTSVEDGDTIGGILNGKPVTIRIYGIDCPENGQAFSTKAKQHVMALCLNKKVLLNRKTIDQRGRIIAEVILEDGRNVGKALITLGYAWHFTRYSDDAEMAQLEKEARDKKKGLWLEDNPIPPWEYAERKKAQ